VSEHEAVTRARRISPGPHLSVLSLRDHPHKQTPAKRAWTVPRLWTHRTRPQAAWKTAQNAVSHTAHAQHVSLQKNKKKIKDQNDVTSTVQIYAVSGERRQSPR